ncbi:MAG: imidazole glycerol phosphate synthase subunit HisH [Promethearchaeota archaeon]|jgi:glutamine amidotransferase
MVFNIAIIDYGMGNLKSISKALHHLNVEGIITSNPKVIRDADGIILPGVGAFGDAMKNLNETNLSVVITDLIKDKKPLFGVCLGQQLLFSKGYEMGQHSGLNIVAGEVLRFDITKVDKVPQIGWNSVKFTNENHFLVQGIPNNSYFYFVHSFYGIPKKDENILGRTKYGEIEFCSVVCNDNVIATQFHPEKSSTFGLKMYENFIHYCRK